jgi:hypothetical protein
VYGRYRAGQSGVMSTSVAESLGLDHADVYSDVEILLGKGYVRADPMAGVPGGAWCVFIQGKGIQGARYGWPENDDRPGDSGINIGSINAPVGAVGQGRDHFTQRVNQTVQHSDLREALEEVKAALAELAEDAEDIKDRHHAVERLGEHLTKEAPEAKPINRTWERIIAFAAVEVAIQGGERIGRALLALWPYVEPWVDGPPPMLPGATT